MELLNLPDLSTAEASTELGWTYSFNHLEYLLHLLRSSTYEAHARKAIERDIEDMETMTQEKYGWIVTNLLAAQMDTVSELGNLCSMADINRFLKRRVNQ